MKDMRYEDYDSLIMGEENSVCYITDFDTYELLHLTKAAMEWYGLKTPDEYRGKKCYKLLQGLDKPCPFCTNGKLKHGEKYKWEHFNEKLGRWMEVEDTLITISGQKCRLERARDITEQRERFRRLSDRLSIEEVLIECIQTLAKEENYDTAFQRFLERLGRYYRAARAYIFEFDQDRQYIYNTYEWCARGVSAQKENLQEIPIAHITRWLEKFRKDGEFYITSLDDEVDRESVEYKILEEQGIKSLLAAPLYSDSEIVGFLGVDDPSCSQDDLRLLRASANFIIEELRKSHLIKRLEYVSYTDLLTGLYNRNKYTEVLSHYELQPPESMGIIFADVNGMKIINDTYGHKYGDRLLIRVATILQAFGRENLYRIGGDEFVMLYENVEREEFRRIIQDLRHAISEDPDCDVSIGGTWCSGDVDVNAMVMQADECMYAEKQSYYQTVLNRGQAERTGIFSEVAKEIEDRRFVVYYQPQIDMKNGQIIGAEALVRKKGLDEALVAPDKFIANYEVEGVIRHVDMFVLEEVCKAMKRWHETGFDLHIAVNFSRVTLMEENIVTKIQEICQRYGVSPELLTIEVTESISKMDQEHLVELMKELMKHGFTVSLDDFGSKYSNLSILSDMDFHTVKIDKSLVDKLEDSEKSRVIMRNTIRMCREMRKTHTLAEGIETKGQMELLADYDCEYGQGFFFSRPLSLEKFNELIYKNAGNICR